ncbi:hypothetical protein [Desulfoluna limicola]|uniref:hypothetical protein n=1 Tax=Desulfoluna limicola TaxID=2810562 RepID=UPI001F48B2D8|nr:hypothetical protein [Desulfoluna limicola]
MAFFTQVSFFLDDFMGLVIYFIFQNNKVTIQLTIASGCPAGGQIFEKFDKQVLNANPLPYLCFKSYGSGLTGMPPPFLSDPQGLREKEAETGKLLRSFFQKVTRRRHR